MIGIVSAFALSNYGGQVVPPIPRASNNSTVIASEAKQSILPFPFCRKMDCFASLAMTNV
jgi:hypothetical protein